MIIGISGKIGSGKDTLGKIIQYLIWNPNLKNSLITFNRWMNDEDIKPHFRYINSKWEIKKFAYILKQIASLLTNISVEDLEKEEVKNSYLGNEWNYNNIDEFIRAPIKSPRKIGDTKMTVRQLLQELGTECGRDVLHPDVWVNSLFSNYKTTFTHDEIQKYNSVQNWIITDMRFTNELEAVKQKNGITIRINRYTGNTDHQHKSETALDNAEFDYVIDNKGDIQELILKVREILIKEQIINDNKTN